MTTSMNIEKSLVAIQGNMMSFAMKLTSNRDDAYDLLQDTTLRVLSYRDKYAENTNFKGWVLTIMRNLFVSGCRQSVRAATVVDTTDDLYHLNVGRDSDTPEDSYAANEISAAIEQLNPSFRKVFKMYIAGYKYDEIADELGIALGTVKSRIFTVRQLLQNRFADYRR